MNNLKYAIMFAGQGSQHVGMVKDVYFGNPKVQQLFERAELITSKPLMKYMFEGPDEVLKQTNITQPCLLTANVSLFETFMEKTNCLPTYVCGHSAGEYAALYAANVLSFDDALKVIAYRGELMNSMDAGSMLAILNATEEEVNLLCGKAVVEGGSLTPANWNSEKQTVISGDIDSIDNALELAFDLNITAIPLPVSGAFHSKLMIPVIAKFERYLKEVTFNNSKKHIVANTIAQPISSSEHWKSAVVEQIVSPVKWKQTIQYLYEQGVNIFIEIGPGNVLSKLVSKDYPDATVLTVNNMESIEHTAQYLNSIVLAKV